MGIERIEYYFSYLLLMKLCIFLVKSKNCFKKRKRNLIGTFFKAFLGRTFQKYRYLMLEMTVSIRYPKGLWPQAGTDYSAVHWKMQVPRRSLVVIVDGRQLRPINVLSSWHGLRLDSDCLRKCHASAECPNRLPMKAQKVEMSLSYIRKGCHRGFFFSPRAEVFPRTVITPEGCLYARAKRGL